MTTDMSATNHYKSKLNMGNLDSALWFLELAEPRQYMRNALYVNSGTDRFLESAHLSGLESTDWTWSTRFCDMDNDGWVDLFFANGMIRNVMDADLQVAGAKYGAQTNPKVLGKLLRESEPLDEKNFGVSQ